MLLTVGDKPGPCEILAPIGAGEMGKVWQARAGTLARRTTKRARSLEGPSSRRWPLQNRMDKFGIFPLLALTGLVTWQQACVSNFLGGSKGVRA